jgi:hypothetical protein
MAAVGGLTGDAAPADPPVKVITVQKIWDQAPHNAFTDLIRFRERWFCTFREGAGHASGAGRIRVITSTDGDQWESAASFGEENVDLRDPKLSITPDGRLMMVGGAAVPATRDPVTDHYSFVCFSENGRQWTKPQRVLASWQWLWRVTWHKGTAYGVAYGWDPKAPANAEKYTATLYKSQDGLKYEKVTDFPNPNSTEATLAFDGERMVCLQRRDGNPRTALVGTSQPPYTEWTWTDLKAYFGGPNLIRTPDGAWWAAGRWIAGGKLTTVHAHLDLKTGTLTPRHTLPSGGDTSYPGLVWHAGELWMSYYSSHEGKSSIYLARFKLPAGP